MPLYAPDPRHHLYKALRGIVLKMNNSYVNMNGPDIVLSNSESFQQIRAPISRAASTVIQPAAVHWILIRWQVPSADPDRFSKLPQSRWYVHFFLYHALELIWFDPWLSSPRTQRPTVFNRARQRTASTYGPKFDPDTSAGSLLPAEQSHQSPSSPNSISISSFGKATLPLLRRMYYHVGNECTVAGSEAGFHRRNKCNISPL